MESSNVYLSTMAKIAILDQKNKSFVDFCGWIPSTDARIAEGHRIFDEMLGAGEVDIRVLEAILRLLEDAHNLGISPMSIYYGNAPLSWEDSAASMDAVASWVSENE